MNREKSSVLIVGNHTKVQALFATKGFDIIYETNSGKKEPSLIVFCGGEDIDPYWYGEDKHFRTRVHPKRDTREMVIYEHHIQTPKVGICRGGQLLNVLSGGKMWQHVEGHINDNNSHEMIDLLFTKSKLTVPSGHHQMMIPGNGSFILGVAQEAKGHISMAKEPPDKPEYDPEVIWYPKTNSLCYQSHPEWNLKDGDTRHIDYFFDLIDWAFNLP